MLSIDDKTKKVHKKIKECQIIQKSHFLLKSLHFGVFYHFLSNRVAAFFSAEEAIKLMCFLNVYTHLPPKFLIFKNWDFRDFHQFSGSSDLLLP